MMGIEWLKPGVFFGSVLYALIGVFVFWVCFLIAEFVLLANGWLATWEDEQPGGFNNPYPPTSG